MDDDPFYFLSFKVLEKRNFMINGITASLGIAIAKAYKLEKRVLNVTKKIVSDSSNELKRLDEAIAKTKIDLDKIRIITEKNLGKEKADIFEAHLLILADPELLGPVKIKIENENINAEAALKDVRDMFVTLFENMDNEYMKERSADILDVTNRMLSHLLNIEINDLSLVDTEVIVISHDLTPSDTAQLNKAFVKGFVTDIGGRTTHSAIMARSLEIPAIVGTTNVMDVVQSGDMIILDAVNGEILVNPTDDVIKMYQEKMKQFEKEKKELKKFKDKETKTLDNVHVDLGANIGKPSDLKGVLENGAEGIGLFRTEFLYMDRNNLPSESEQFDAYSEVLIKMEQKPVVIRTLDIGGDKKLSYLKMPEELNPFLGYRAIRLCLDQKDIFKTQLRALLRASIYGNLKIMFPMIATLEEFNEAKAFLLSVKAELISEGIKVGDDIEIGIMVEIPSAALLAEQFSKVVDFFSIGTNDLIQYTFAADRMNEHVSYLYQPYHPSLLKLIKMVIDAAHKENKWVGMCGEMAGDEIAVPILLGLGLDEFSMSATSILKTRLLLAGLKQNEMTKLSEIALKKATNNEVKEYVWHQINIKK